MGGNKQIVSTDGLPRLIQKRPDFSLILIHRLFQRKNIHNLKHFFRLNFELIRSGFAETEVNFCILDRLPLCVAIKKHDLAEIFNE